MEFGIEKCAILLMKGGKRETAEGIELLKSVKNKNSWREGKWQVLGNIESRHHQASQVEGKNTKWISQKHEKTSRNQILLQKSHQRDNHLGNLSSKILRTILKVDKWGTQINGSKNKALHSRDNDDRLYVSRKEGGRGFTSIEEQEHKNRELQYGEKKA